MSEIKLRVSVRRPLASGARGALPLVGGVCRGVTAGNESRNASNARGVTAGKMGRNSSCYNAHSFAIINVLLLLCLVSNGRYTNNQYYYYYYYYY